MKTSIGTLIYVLAFLASPVKAATNKSWKTTDINLFCEGQMKAISISHFDQQSHSMPTRSPIPQITYTKVAEVQFKITEATPGCGHAQLQFNLPFTLKAGSILKTHVGMYGIHTDQEFIDFITIGSGVQFNLKEEFYSATSDGSLPMFPYYHSESITIETSGSAYAKSINVNLNKEELKHAVKNNFNNDFNDDFNEKYIFIQSYPAYGVPASKNLSDSQKLQHIQKMIEHAKTLDLTNPEILGVVKDALYAYSPATYSDGAKTLEFLNLVLPFFDQVTLHATTLQNEPEQIKSIYASLQASLYPFVAPYGNVPADIKTGISIYLKLPLILQASTGNQVYLTKEAVEEFLTEAKKLILSGVLTNEKVLQFKATAQFMKDSYDHAQYALNYPLTDASLKLIADINTL